MPKAILFTQCLQNDFVRPIGPREPLPNRLHIGARESRRLMGEMPGEGPVARMMEWAYQRTAEELLLIHLRDRHSAGDASQATHLRQFGSHCLTGDPGADLAFQIPAGQEGQAFEVYSLTLNDFQGTGLQEILEPYAGQALSVGLMGVWTEAKVLFLGYELATRYPSFKLGVCSALTASSSRAQHFLALDQLQRILGVRVCPSVGEFMEFLCGSSAECPLPGCHDSFPTLTLDPGCALPQDDEQLVRYLFRDCRLVTAHVLDGGFSGNAVLGVSSVDLHGHQQVPHVLKIGPRDAIGQERTAFERIEEVLGNNAPHIRDFADLGDRGAINYRYASMSVGQVTTFQKSYMQGLPLEQVRVILKAVFEEQLGRLYSAAELESCNLLDYYGFSSRWAPHVRARVEALLGAPAATGMLELAGGETCPNLCAFYEQALEGLDPLRRDTACFSYVHGDLNGANIILDSHQNVWLIDFFHTHRGHVLKDLIKLENDLLYIFTPIPDEQTLKQAVQLSNLLLEAEDLTAPLPELPPMAMTAPQLLRAYAVVRILREFYPQLIQSDGSPLQWLIGAMRYAVHTLSFDESSPFQKQWALYAAARCSAKILDTISPHRVPSRDLPQPRPIDSGNTTDER